MFSLDRDLIIHEPNLFTDVHWAGQQTIVNDAGVMTSAGTTLNLPSGQNFDAAGVRQGDVLTLNGITVEVVSLTSSAIAVISKLRDSTADDPIGVLDGATGVKVRGWTFRPQAVAIHEQLLTALGLVAGQGDADAPGEGMVLNPRDLARVEALGTLHLIYTSAAALVGDASPLWVKAQMYRDRFAAERRRVAAALDLDGDGIADAVRRLSVFRFVRS